MQTQLNVSMLSPWQELPFSSESFQDGSSAWLSLRQAHSIHLDFDRCFAQKVEKQNKQEIKAAHRIL